MWVAFEELKRHATNAPIPPIPPGFRVRAHLVVDILIGTDGRVKCVKLPQAHPLLQVAALKAAREWRFEPFSVVEHPVAILGRIEFTFGP